MAAISIIWRRCLYIEAVGRRMLMAIIVARKALYQQCLKPIIMAREKSLVCVAREMVLSDDGGK